MYTHTRIHVCIRKGNSFELDHFKYFFRRNKKSLVTKLVSDSLGVTETYYKNCLGYT